MKAGGIDAAAAAADSILLEESQTVQQQGAELGVLPAVDEDVDAGVEHEQEVGAVRQDLAPAQGI